MTEVKQIDDPELSAGFHAKVRQNAVDLEENLSIASRLMRRAHQETIPVPLDDDLVIEIYVPTEGEVLDLIKLQTDVYKSGKSFSDAGEDITRITDGIDTIADAYARLNLLLARLTVDESLDYTFWSSGAISANDKREIITGILSTIDTNREKIGKFRKSKPR